MRKRIVAGNWKMNLSLQEGEQLALGIIKAFEPKEIEVILIPPFIHLSSLNNLKSGSSIKLGSQNNFTEDSGAFTGEISTSMLKSVGVSYGLVGHSERRSYFNEESSVLKEKADALLRRDIKVIFCCGESLDQRKSANHFKVVEEQLEILWNYEPRQFKSIVVAYEPVWAIGTGETASAFQAQEMHGFIRNLIEQKMGKEIALSTSILYGGSCKPQNAKELFAQPDVDGGLIGGASLKAEDFVTIANSFPE